MNKGDLLVQLIPSLLDTTLLGKVYTNLLTWKFASLRHKDKVIDHKELSDNSYCFVKLDQSKFLVYMKLHCLNPEVLSVWDIEQEKGYVLEIGKSLNLKGLEYRTFNAQSISEINATIFNSENGVKSFDERAFEMLKQLSISKEHSSKSPDELAIKALKLTLAFDKWNDDVKQSLS